MAAIASAGWRSFPLALLLVAMGSAPAQGGTYAVTSCTAAPGAANNAWTFAQTGPSGQLEQGSDCVGAPDQEFQGLWVRDRLGPPDSDNSVSGAWFFLAPPSTTISALTYKRFLRSSAQPFRAFLQKDSNVLVESCLDTFDTLFCELGRPGGDSSTVTFSGLNAARLDVGVRCEESAGELCGNGGTQHHGEAVIYGATVTVNDPVAPTIVSGPTGSLFAGGWLRGAKSAGVTGRDSTGVERLQLRRDGNVVVATDSRTCDFTFAAPCASPGADVASGWGPVDTATWPDGSHQVVAAVRDAGGLEGLATRTVLTDNTAPIAPQAGAFDGRLWSNVAARQVQWTLPAGQASPIVSAAVTLCPVAGGPCAPASTVSLTSATVNLPAEGSYEARIVLTDEAGNTNPANVAVVPLGYDASAGPAPALGAPERQGSTFVVPVEAGGDPGPAPVARLQGELCSAAGTCEPVAAQDRLDQVTVTVSGPGTYTLRVQTVDAADNLGAFATAMFTLPADPTPTATPTPSATPGPKTSQLKLTRARLTKRQLKVSGAVSPSATGRVRVKVSARRRSATKTVLVQPRGAFRATLTLPVRARGVRKVRLAVRYGGDAAFRPRTLTRAVRR